MLSLGNYCREVISRQGANRSETGGGAASRDELLAMNSLYLRVEIEIMEDIEEGDSDCNDEYIDQEVILLNKENLYNFVSAEFEYIVPMIAVNEDDDTPHVVEFELLTLKWRLFWWRRQLILQFNHNVM